MCPMNMAVLQFGKQNVPHEHDSAITTLRGEEIDIELSELIEDEKKIENSKLEAGGGNLGKSARSDVFIQAAIQKKNETK